MKMQQQIHQRATWVIALTCFLTWPALSQFSMNQYDIWVYNPRTGSNIKWATLNGTGEFNPAWSPNGKLMAFDVTTGSGQTIAISNGALTHIFPSPDFDLANNPAWHPSGNTLLFDQDFSVYTTDRTGSYKTLLITDAYDAQFSHRTGNGRYVVFTRASTGRIHILDTESGVVGPAIADGENARFAPNDRALAYVSNGDIFRIRLNGALRPVGSPVAVTSTPANDEGRPDWISQNQLVFHADYGGGGLASYDLYTLRIVGHATPVRLTGFPGAGDFDPAYATSNGKIAYAGDGSSVFSALKAPETTGTDIGTQQGEVYVFPNPVTDVINVRLDLPVPGKVELSVIDLMGRVYDRQQKELLAGKQLVEVHLDDKVMPTGTYFLKVCQDRAQWIVKWIKN